MTSQQKVLVLILLVAAVGCAALWLLYSNPAPAPAQDDTAQMLQALNNIRHGANKPPITLDQNLSQVAQAQASWMAANNKFAAPTQAEISPLTGQYGNCTVFVGSAGTVDLFLATHPQIGGMATSAGTRFGVGSAKSNWAGGTTWRCIIFSGK